MRHLSLLLALLLALTGVACTPTAEGPPPPIDLTPLQEPMAEVAAAQRRADDQLATVLAAVRDLDTSIGAFREPETVDDARAGWEQVAASFEAAETEGLREGYIELARAVDDARLVLHDIREGLDEDEWEREYLDVEYEALTAIRGYAEETDALVRAVLTHWPTYEAIHDETERFVEERWLYRDSQEAADAYELAVSGQFGALELAQEEIAAGLERRETAAEEANDAVRTAREVFEDQPTPEPGEPAATAGR